MGLAPVWNARVARAVPRHLPSGRLGKFFGATQVNQTKHSSKGWAAGWRGRGVQAAS